jgi:hypothetical protein
MTQPTQASLLSLTKMIEQGLSAVRPWLALAATLGAGGTWAATYLLLSHPELAQYDVWLNGLSGLILTLAALWLAFGRGSVLRFSIVLLVIEILIITVRLVFALVTVTPLPGFTESLPPLSIWVPLLFVASFLLLPAREALYLTCVPMGILMIAVVVFAARSQIMSTTSFEMLNMLQQYLVMHPLLVLLLYLISRVAQEQRAAMAAAYARETAHGDSLEQDDWIEGLSRPAMLHLLQRTLDGRPLKPRTILADCHLAACEALIAAEGERAARARMRKLAEGLRRAAAGNAIIGRLDSHRLLLLVTGTTLGPAELAAQLQQYAASHFQELKPRVRAIAVEAGMTPEIALQTLEITGLMEVGPA